MSANSYNESTSASIDMTDFDKDNSPLTSTIDNDIAASTLTATRTPPNLASDWPSADCASGGWIDQGMDNDENDSDDPAEQEQFDRISGILSQLIQEANNAINSTSSSPGHQVSTPTMAEYDDDDDDDDDDDALVENTPIMEGDGGDHVGWSISTIDDIISEATDDLGNMDEDTPVRSTSPLPIQLPLYEPQTMMERTVSASTSTTRESRRRSRLPRPKKLSLEILHHQHHPSYHNRSSSTMSTSSSSSSNMDYDDDTLFSPISSSLTTPMSRTISPLLFEKGLYTQLSRQGSISEAELALLCGRAVQNQRDDNSEMEEEEYTRHLQDNNDALMSPSGSLMASFERLDSSLAIVDSLSRDLANYRRQHPRQRNSTSTHPMTTTTTTTTTTNSHCSLLSTDTTTFDSSSLLLSSTNPAVETTTSTVPFDDNTYTNQHCDGRSSGSRNWVAILLVGPVLYIPYLLMASLWEQITVAMGTTTSPFSLLLSTVSAMMFDDRHTFASLKSTLITTITSTAVIGNGGGGGGDGMVPPCIGLAVFLLFLAILHLLKGDCVIIDQATAGDGRQFMDISSYNDQSNKMIRRSSLPMMPCLPSLSRRNSF